MPTVLKTKNSVTTTVAPTSLAQGELAVNITDKKMWVGNAATTPVQLLGAGATNRAGGSNTQVQYNSSGDLAGSANMTFSGTALTLANDASISGLTVGKGGSAVASNTALGASALVANTSGSSNTAIGKESSFKTTTGTNNLSSGIFSLYQNTTGSSNVALGSSALENNTTASNNTAVGYQALYTNTTSVNSTAVGHKALFSNTSGTPNGAFGYQALRANTTGSYNNAFGSSDNAVGSALEANTTGSYNNAFGNGALTTNTIGVANTAIGHAALNTNNASNNTAFGFQSGYSNSSGTGNTFLGYQAGYSISTGSKNTFVGAFASGVGSAGAQITTGSSNTILGAYNGNQDGLDIRTSSNRAVISDGDGNIKCYWDTDDSQFSYVTPGNSQFRTYAASNGTYANNATVDFGSMSGLIIVNNWSTGANAIWLCGGGSIALISSVGGGFGTLSFTGAYRWTNTSGSTYSYSFTGIATRASA